ncbi:TonB-dependent receptor [Hymenobacter sp. ISL-91]|uniref:TonB-dependent receptor n=1 Tax=Hymenobacter sp. ISL-91 TaxID=2819151 RepID=UPI001BEA2F53|nr:TonB-dependent receptor [Hymenobacter sp. ISL-91]MBT2556387.1 TonB-dependent receptor [Hymenobacter sp. ISL-91]
MLRFFITTGFALGTGLAVAQTASQTPAAMRATTTAPVTGRVTDAATGQAMPGATVYFPDLRQATATDENGQFSFADLPRGRFLMQVRFVGYSTVARNVDTGTSTPIDVVLEPTATEIGQVVVTGVSASTELRRSPVPTTVIGQAQLQQTSATNAVDALAHVPGLSQITTGAAISKPVIRGLGANRVITLNNGAKQEGQQWGDEHGIEIDEFSIDRAEIIKGPGSLLYGSDGLAGVINFLPPEPVAEGRVLGAVAATYQTNNQQQGYSLWNAGNLGGLNWQLRGSGKLAGNYRNERDGRVYNSGARELNGSGYVGVNKGWGYSHLTFNSFNQQLGLIEGARDSLTGRFLKSVPTLAGDVADVPVTRADLRGYGLAVPRQQINHLRIGTDNSFILGRHRLTANLGWQQNLRREFGNPADADENSLFFQLHTVDYALRWFLPEANGWNTTFGVSGMQQENQNKGVEFLIPAYRLLDGGVFGVTKKTVGRLDVSGGLRYDVRRIKADALYLNADEQPVPAGLGDTKFGGFTSTFRNVSGSLGAAYSLGENLVLKANAARGFRAPNIAELGSNGKHEGTVRYEIGEPDLKAETSFQLDGGLAFTSEHIDLSVDAFRNRISNYIFPRVLGAAGGGDSLSVEGDQVFRYGQGDARLAGGEISLDLHPHPLDWLHFENSFSMVRAVQLNQPAGQRNLPFIPADRFQSELRVNFAKVSRSRLRNLYARTALEHNFAQNRVFSAFETETRTPGYTLVNLGLGSDVVSAKDRTLFSLYLTLNNVFDVAYQNHLSRLKYTDVNYATGRQGVFNMGRNLSVKLIVPLSFK